MFGFLQKMRLESKVNRLEGTVADNSQHILDNYNKIQNMSALISSNAMAIDQLKVITSDLGQRMVSLENKVDALCYQVDSIADDQQTMLRLNLVANLILRIKQSVDTGYDTPFTVRY